MFKSVFKLFGLGAALVILALAAGNSGQAGEKITVTFLGTPLIEGAAQANHNVRITLQWFNKADVDLYVTEPSGEVIGPPPGGGTLHQPYQRLEGD